MSERFIWRDCTPDDSPHGSVRDTQDESFDDEYLDSESCAKLLNEMHSQLQSKTKLPRVQPEGLIPGKVYLTKHTETGWIDFVFFNGVMSDGTSVYRWAYRNPTSTDEYSAFWGPIPEFELEGE